jgi:hypothetical protein
MTVPARNINNLTFHIYKSGDSMLTLLNSIEDLIVNTRDRKKNARTECWVTLANSYEVCISTDNSQRAGTESFEVAVYDEAGDFAKCDLSWWREVFFFQDGNEVARIVKAAAAFKPGK